VLTFCVHVTLAQTFKILLTKQSNMMSTHLRVLLAVKVKPTNRNASLIQQRKPRPLRPNSTRGFYFDSAGFFFVSESFFFLIKCFEFAATHS